MTDYTDTAESWEAELLRRQIASCAHMSTDELRAELRDLTAEMKAPGYHLMVSVAKARSNEETALLLTAEIDRRVAAAKAQSESAKPLTLDCMTAAVLGSILASTSLDKPEYQALQAAE